VIQYVCKQKIPIRMQKKEEDGTESDASKEWREEERATGKRGRENDWE